MPIPDTQAGPVLKRGGAGISYKYRQHVYDLCNARLRDELTADQWDEEIQRLEQMKQ